jgi:hypothetical protein
MENASRYCWFLSLPDFCGTDEFEEGVEDSFC